MTGIALCTGLYMVVMFACSPNTVVACRADPRCWHRTVIEGHPQPGGGRSMTDIALLSRRDMVRIFSGSGSAVMA
jgi:hypothetical protein